MGISEIGLRCFPLDSVDHIVSIDVMIKMNPCLNVDNIMAEMCFRMLMFFVI